MKLLILLLLAASASAQVAPIKADLPKYSREGIIKIARQLQAISKEATAKAEALDDKLRSATLKLGQAEAQTIELQRTLDEVKLELFKAEQRLESWLKFGRIVLICVSGVVFVFAFQALGKVPMAWAGPWAWLARTGIALAAGLAAAWMLFRVITKTL